MSSDHLLCSHTKKATDVIEVLGQSVSTTSTHTLLVWNAIDTVIPATLQIWRVSHIHKHAHHKRHAQLRGGGLGDAEPASPWAVWELFWDLSSPPWVLLSFSVRDAGCFCGGRFSCRINEKLRLSHEKSIFSIYLASCTPEAHIRRRRLVLAYSGAFVMHSLPLLWCSVGRLPSPAPPPSPQPLLVESLAFLVFAVGRKNSHSSTLRWNMARNWKSARIIGGKWA